MGEERVCWKARWSLSEAGFLFFCFLFSYVETHFQFEFQERGPKESSLSSPSPEQFIVMVFESWLGRNWTRPREHTLVFLWERLNGHRRPKVETPGSLKNFYHYSGISCKTLDEFNWRSPTHLMWSFSGCGRRNQGDMYPFPLLSMSALWPFLYCVLYSVFRAYASISLPSGPENQAEVLGLG